MKVAQFEQLRNEDRRRAGMQVAGPKDIYLDPSTLPAYHAIHRRGFDRTPLVPAARPHGSSAGRSGALVGSGALGSTVVQRGSEW